jgi:hypothetical protein
MTSPKSQTMPQEAPPESDFEDIPDEDILQEVDQEIAAQPGQSSTVDPDLSTNKTALRFTAFSPRLALPRTPTLPSPIPYTLGIDTLTNGVQGAAIVQCP